MARRLNWGGIALSFITGTSLAAVGVMGYVRYEHPEQFAQGSVKQARPEAWDDQQKQWGAYGSGLSDLIPNAVANFFEIDQIPARVEAHRRRREKEIIDAIRNQTS
ncbi:hypothetical protein H257_13552 [Aphanomyces astaci]|uniref:Uncharacterized protein n=1 Tax=Aphanomyces astaci TaxID=112090 RepID=W4FW62_APHAT|nr:hypothetical protein H257_13552 [Aphanomyces astaci]ETV71161.1 hypothetical protein H257_13552 [Aphanomyces astaci]KAF0775463.1 hypothetical protein AaE_000834 [Aphanomyces astaci]RHY00036.1 hypothetical protein DYB36_001374 [Aphanomyces astaci]RHY09563.1 hypothetical protein DYB25_002084 [Aphanomyces astaci]RHY57970.1 hypothetical protein DYB34_001333 [Aphanomyces astaci]|eukprot:XP_009839407.1 hypothetical protein H257_13552 [Aphanomyces astaci]